MQNLDFTGKINFTRKKRSLEEEVIPSDVVTVTKATTPSEVITNIKNGILKGIHLLDIIDSKTEDSYIPVVETRQDVRDAVSVLDPSVEDGAKVYFTFYKTLIQGVYENILSDISDLSDDYSTDSLGTTTATSGVSTKVTRVVKKSGINSEIANLLLSGSSALMIYLLHKVMLPYTTSVVAEGTTQPNAIGLTKNALRGVIAQAAVYKLNDVLAGILENSTSGTYTTTESSSNETAETDPVVTTFSELLNIDHEMLILDYVDNFLKNNYDSEYYSWRFYEETYARILALYNKALLTGDSDAYDITTLADGSVSVPDEYKELCSNLDNPMELFEQDKAAVVSIDKHFDSIAKALADAPMIQNAICCLFKFFSTFSSDDLKYFIRLLKVAKIFAGKRLAASECNKRTSALFLDKIAYNVTIIGDEIKDKLTASFNAGHDDLLGCFSVRDFVDCLLELIDSMITDAKLCLEFVKNLYIGLDFSLDVSVETTINSKYIDYLIDLAEYVYDSLDVCELNDPDDPRAPYVANNYVSNYINPNVSKFVEPSWADTYEVTAENSYTEKIVTEYNGHRVILNQDPVDAITKDYYVSCSERASSFDI